MVCHKEKFFCSRNDIFVMVLILEWFNICSGNGLTYVPGLLSDWCSIASAKERKIALENF